MLDGLIETWFDRTSSYADPALMSSLAEIETAATTLPSREKLALLLFVAGQLREEGAALPEPRLFSPEQLAAWRDEDEEDMRKFSL